MYSLYQKLHPGNLQTGYFVLSMKTSLDRSTAMTEIDGLSLIFVDFHVPELIP